MATLLLDRPITLRDAGERLPARQIVPEVGRPIRWPGGEAVICTSSALVERAARSDSSFAAIFAMRSARTAWESAGREQRVVIAGPRSEGLGLTGPGVAEALLVSLQIPFMLEASGTPWHPNLRFVRLQDPGDDIAWLMAAALRRECLDGGRHGAAYAARIAGVLAARLVERHATLDCVQPLQGGLTGRRLRSCLDHIERNLHRDISLSELAELAGLSTTHLARAFRRSVGEPPYRYFRRRRIERAKELLATSDRGIAEIALECGYAAQSHFTSAFKAETMTTPAAYRRATREASDRNGSNDRTRSD